MGLVIDGTLPVAIEVKAGERNLKLNRVQMEAKTVRELLAIQTGLKPHQYTAIGELCGVTKLVEVKKETDGTETIIATYPLDYEALMDSAGQNLNYLTNLRADLDVKVQAASEPQP